MATFLMHSADSRESFVLDGKGLDALLGALRERGYQLIGPRVRDGAIVYDEIAGTTDLPVGWGDDQSPGHYRLRKRADGALFGYAVGPHSWKKQFFPPAERLLQVTRNGKSLAFAELREPAGRRALIGVRACELQAIGVQDRVFMRGAHVDATYQARRENVFILAVQCGQPAGTCFCVSMGNGPKAASGFDLALTEVVDPDNHYFVIEVGTPLGEEIIRAIKCTQPDHAQRQAAAAVSERAAAQMGRSLKTADIKELLYRNYEHPRWDEVANRCLSCANCTLVCPTCFCSTVEDVTDLQGEQAERWRKWGSCFTMDFSYIHGGSVRGSTRARYRQWMTHKLATWYDQFGTSGCVGCGRCITWCPVGIDITAEVQAIRHTDTQVRPVASGVGASP